MKHQWPSHALLKSLVWTEDYAEEGDSGVVVLHKGKLPVFTALLHIGWQNARAVRGDTTYQITYGDKESWWFGFELCGVPHVLEEHYGAVIGEVREQNEKRHVCGFAIAHVDENDKLIWYNGSLLKNKALDKTAFDIPSYWMVDAKWEKGATKSDMSRMKGGTVRVVTVKERNILQKMVEVAKRVDADKSLL
jgi:alpha 1,3-mannosyltransferase